MGLDGATITATRSDSNNKEKLANSLVIVPAEASTEADISSTFVTGPADQNGVFRSPVLSPGKYLVWLISGEMYPEYSRIAALYRARSKAKQVELSPHGSVNVSLEVTELR